MFALILRIHHEQAVWKPRASSIPSYAQEVAYDAQIMRNCEAAESRQRETFKVAKNTDAKIQQLALSESLRDTGEYTSHRRDPTARAP